MSHLSSDFDPTFSESTLKIRRNMLFCCTLGLFLKVYGSEAGDVKFLYWFIKATSQQINSMIAVFIFYLAIEWITHSLPEFLVWYYNKFNDNGYKSTYQETKTSINNIASTLKTLTGENIGRESERLNNLLDLLPEIHANSFSFDLFRKRVLIFEFTIPSLYGYLMCLYFANDLYRFFVAAVSALF